MDKEKKKHRAFVIVAVAVALLGGVYLGMVIQQMIFVAGMVEFGRSLEGTNIEVNIDFNETELIQGFKETLIPILNTTEKDKS